MSKTAFFSIFFLIVGIGYSRQDCFASVSRSDNRLFYQAQTAELKLWEKADTVIPKPSPVKRSKKDDPFSSLMAGVVNDTAILYDTYVDVVPKKDTVKIEMAKTPPVKIDTPPVVMEEKKLKTDTSQKGIAAIKTMDKKRDSIHAAAAFATEKKPNADSLQKKMATAKLVEKKRDSVHIAAQFPYTQKLSEQRSDSALQLVYADMNKQGKNDTILLFIPFETTANLAKPEAIKKNAEPGVTKKDSALAAIKKEEKTNTEPTAITVAPEHTKKDSAVITKKTPPKITVVNSDCKIAATDYDVDKLRIKMMAVDNEDDKILIARKLFKIKCFTTNQIKALSEVFPKDEGRYKFFDTAYPFVSDSANFSQLAALLTEQYYINRFNAMVR